MATPSKGRPLSNPLLATALPFLSVLSRVRLGEVETSPDALRDAARGYIKKAEANAAAEQMPENLVQLAKVNLAAMVDDVCETLPGYSPDQTRPLTLEMFGVESGSQGFFRTLKTATERPKDYAPLLELMLVCIGLGYEGRYRYEPRGAARVAQKQSEGWAALQTVETRDKALSHKWKPVVLRDPLQRRAAPIWMVAGVAAAMVFVLFASLASVLTSEAQAVQTVLRDVHSPQQVSILRATVPAPPAPKPLAIEETPASPEPSLFEQMQTGLEATSAQVETLGDFIVIRLGEELQFGSGSPDLNTELTSIVAPIAEVLDSKPGRIVIEGHSDNIPLSGFGLYKTNEALSEARAQVVADALAPLLSDPSRVTVIGVGPARPLSRENTPEARDLNRRVEILLSRGGD